MIEWEVCRGQSGSGPLCWNSIKNFPGYNDRGTPSGLCGNVLEKVESLFSLSPMVLQKKKTCNILFVTILNIAKHSNLQA